jgi:hypothetical protein
MTETLDELQRLNPGIEIRHVSAPGFDRYGRVLTRYDPSEIIARAKAILPESHEIVYEPSVAPLEAPSPFNKAIEQNVYGGIPIQVGWCYGENLQMAGLEYHKGNELLVCMTDVVLLVGDVRDIAFEGRISYETNKVAAFYAPEGSVTELFSWSLHFAPIQVREGGSFATLVYLPRGTNEPLTFCVDDVGENRLLFGVNKWLIVHPDAEELVGQGAYAGLVGQDIYIRPV